MSQFLVIKDLNFDNIMICFDNSSDELEYTTYKSVNLVEQHTNIESANQLIEKLTEEGFEELDGDMFLNNQDDIKTILIVEFYKDHVKIKRYTYEEHDGGVHEIIDDSKHDIYHSRFDDYKNTITYILGGYINKDHIFEIEE